MNSFKAPQPRLQIIPTLFCRLLTFFYLQTELPFLYYRTFLVFLLCLIAGVPSIFTLPGQIKLKRSYDWSNGVQSRDVALTSEWYICIGFRPLRRDILGISDRRETPGHTKGKLERFYHSAVLETPRCPVEELKKVAASDPHPDWWLSLFVCFYFGLLALKNSPLSIFQLMNTFYIKQRIIR